VCVCRGWRKTQIEKKIDGERERESVCKRESERVRKNTTEIVEDSGGKRERERERECLCVCVRVLERKSESRPRMERLHSDRPRTG